MSLSEKLKPLLLPGGKVNPKWKKVAPTELKTEVEHALVEHGVGSLSELIWVLQNGKATCKTCGAGTTFIHGRGYREFCSRKCAARNEKTKATRFETNLLVYGDGFPQKLETVKQKARSTTLSRYGEKPAHYFGGGQRGSRKDAVEHRATTINKQFEKRMEPRLRALGLSAIGPLSSREPTVLQHSCGFTFSRRVWSSQVPRCPKCFPHQVSTQHLKVRDWLLSRAIEFIENDRTLIAPKEVDFYLPGYRLAIEVNGLFWHSEAAGTFAGYHQEKTLSCLKKGVTLVHLYEDQIDLRFDEVTNRLTENYIEVEGDIDLGEEALLVDGNWPLPQQFSVKVVEVLKPRRYPIDPSFKKQVKTPVWDAGQLIYTRTLRSVFSREPTGLQHSCR